ncbi:13399_t:CDS:1, partial [Funneliformis geosporum]
WHFGTVHKNVSPIGIADCNAMNDPNYIINISVSDIFYDPPIAAIVYIPSSSIV